MNNLLPIGSVVLLKSGKKKVMIYGRKQIHLDTGKMYDYISCLYPEGNVSPEFTFLFNHEDIEKVFFKGYIDGEEIEFQELLYTSPKEEN